jgi:3-oxoacyl-[acyl-carrier protein] reductase
MNKLDGKTAIVTGAGRGVGQATAIKLAGDGAIVVANDLDESAISDTLARVEKCGGRAIGFTGDVTAVDFGARLIDRAVEETGRIDVIVNNAGYIWNSAMHNTSDEQWQAMLDVHATAPFRVLRAFAPWLRDTAKREIAEEGRARCRKVVNVSSVSGTRGNATQIAYSAGKAAVVGITKTLAKEWGRYNVTVNCVAFGHINTRLTQPYEDEPPTIEVSGRDYRVGLSNAQLRSIEVETPLGRSGEPEDGAGAIYLFCIPESDFVTGEVLTCSGGL